MVRFAQGIRLSLVALAGFAGLTASAAPLSTNSELEPVPSGSTPGGIVSDHDSNPFSAGTFSGLIDSWAIDNDGTNGLGGYTFVYRVSNSSSSDHNLVRLTLSSFDGFLTDVSWYSNSASEVEPESADRSLTGDVIGFSFASTGTDALGPGEVSKYLVVRTNAPAYTSGIAAMIDGTTTQANVLVAAIPEPTSLGLIAGAGVLLMGRRRRA